MPVFLYPFLTFFSTAPPFLISLITSMDSWMLKMAFPSLCISMLSDPRFASGTPSKLQCPFVMFRRVEHFLSSTERNSGLLSYLSCLGLGISRLPRSLSWGVVCRNHALSAGCAQGTDSWLPGPACRQR